MLGRRGSRYYSSLEFAQKSAYKSKVVSDSNRRRKVTWGNKISASLKGYRKTNDHQDKITSSLRNRWNKDKSELLPKVSRSGSNHSDETRLKISQSVKGQKFYHKINENGETIIKRFKEDPGPDWTRGRPGKKMI
jgi:hypothetical protein